MAVNVQQLPYIAPRKDRKPETRRFVVKWLEGTSVNFRWYCRDSDAVKPSSTTFETSVSPLVSSCPSDVRRNLTCVPSTS
jgi:hypothetical protein